MTDGYGCATDAIERVNDMSSWDASFDDAPVTMLPALAPVDYLARLRGGGDVLLAEDHEINQRIVRLILEPAGFRITVVENGVEALEEAARRPFDVILMDMQMPLMGGLEAAVRIRAGGGPNAATPIVALSAHALDDRRSEWLPVGVEAFLSKPVNMDLLIDTVSRAACVETQKSLQLMSA
jgi:CheY-like chemotaxis protein